VSLTVFGGSNDVAHLFSVYRRAQWWSLTDCSLLHRSMLHPAGFQRNALFSFVQFPLETAEMEYLVACCREITDAELRPASLEERPIGTAPLCQRRNTLRS